MGVNVARADLAIEGLTGVSSYPGDLSAARPTVMVPYDATDGIPHDALALLDTS